jgi:hypothetical protein
VFFSIMTSKTQKFPRSVDSQIIRTGPADYGFLTTDTIIDLRQVHAAQLTAIANQREFGVKGYLITTEHAADVDTILRASMTVEERVLERVVKP